MIIYSGFRGLMAQFPSLVVCMDPPSLRHRTSETTIGFYDQSFISEKPGRVDGTPAPVLLCFCLSYHPIQLHI